MKNLCVLITGQMRTNILSGEELTTKDITDHMNLNIFNDYMKDNFNYDVFIASDSIDIEQTKEFFGDKLNNVCLTKKSWIDPNNSTPDFYLKEIDRKIPPIEYFLDLYETYDLTNYDSYKYQVYQFYRLLTCFNLVEDYTKYDYILKIRPDIIYKSNFSEKFEYLNNNDECQLIGITDLFAIGRSDIMKHYCELVYKFGSYNKDLKNYNIIDDNLIESIFFNDPDTKRWAFSPEIQLACHLYEYCETNKLNISNVLKKGYDFEQIHVIRHWMIDMCNQKDCYVCNSGLCKDDTYFKKFNKFISEK